MAWQPSLPRAPRSEWQQQNEKPRVLVEAALAVAQEQQRIKRDNPLIGLLNPAYYRPVFRDEA